jgi:hypothetical protein
VYGVPLKHENKTEDFLFFEDGCLLGCSAVKSGLIALMMETARTSEMLVNFYQTTRRYNPEDSHLLVPIALTVSLSIPITM